MLDLQEQITGLQELVDTQHEQAANTPAPPAVDCEATLQAKDALILKLEAEKETAKIEATKQVRNDVQRPEIDCLVLTNWLTPDFFVFLFWVTYQKVNLADMIDTLFCNPFVPLNCLTSWELISLLTTN